MHTVSRSSLAAIVALALTGCSFGNLSPERCATDGACAVAFGAGSACADGYCTDPATCETTSDCRKTFGYGATCEAQRCALAAAEPRCSLSEPPSLAGEFPGTVGDRLLIGALLKDTTSQNARASAMRLAVDEINVAGGIDGLDVALLVCRNDATATTTDSVETARLTEYLAGSLGVPLILGPASSANVAAAIGVLKVKALPTTLISPSATAAGLTDDPVVFDGRMTGLFWRTCPRDTLQAAVLVGEIAKSMVTSVTVVYQNDAYGSGIETAFREGWTAAGNTMTSLPFRVDSNLATDLAKAAVDAKAKNAAALLVVASDAATTLTFLNEAAKNAFTTPKLFLTDGSRSTVMLDPKQPKEVQALIRAAVGTGPAAFDPNAAAAYAKFVQQMNSLYGVTVTGFGFVSHSYDAAYVGAYGLLYGLTAAKHAVAGFDGFDVAAGLTRLSSGSPVNVGQTDFTKAAAALTGGKNIDIYGISGPLDFDPARGEAPGPIEVWVPNKAFTDFDTVMVVPPQ